MRPSGLPPMETSKKLDYTSVNIIHAFFIRDTYTRGLGIMIWDRLIDKEVHLQKVVEKWPYLKDVRPSHGKAGCDLSRKIGVNKASPGQLDRHTWWYRLSIVGLCEKIRHQLLISTTESCIDKIMMQIIYNWRDSGMLFPCHPIDCIDELLECDRRNAFISVP